MAEGFTQTNVNLTDEDVQHLEQMMTEDGSDNRSAFMRRLVRQEWVLRHPRSNSPIHPQHVEMIERIAKTTRWNESAVIGIAIERLNALVFCEPNPALSLDVVLAATLPEAQIDPVATTE